jgi:hypothetical protein
MRRNKKAALVTTSLAVLIVIGAMVAGCTQTAEQPEPDANVPVVEQPEPETDVPVVEPGEPDATTQASPRMEGRGMPVEMMNDVAEVLGIEPEQLEAAFTKAQSELAETSVAEPSPDLLTSRVAEILGIEPQELADAMTQVIGEMPADASPPGPPGGGPGPGDSEGGPTP